MMRPAPHLPLRWLADLADGVLPPQRRVTAETHLDTGCDRCVRRASTVRRLLRAITSGELEAPPSSLDRRVAEVLARSMPHPVRNARNVIVGRLVLDQRLELAAAVRTAAADTRKLLWTVGEHELDASLVTHSAGTDLLGQVLPAGDVAGSAVSGHVEARCGRRLVSRVPVERDGRFTFRRLAPGAYVLGGEFDGKAFVLPRLVLE